MTKFIETSKPSGYDENLHKLGLYLPYNILAIKDGKQYDFSIKVRDIDGRPDCKIGDVCNNIWFRPKQALLNNWSGYKSYSNLSRAVQNCLIKNGFKVLGWYKSE